jgi:hypothetical protein
MPTAQRKHRSRARGCCPLMCDSFELEDVPVVCRAKPVNAKGERINWKGASLFRSGAGILPTFFPPHAKESRSE